MHWFNNTNHIMILGSYGRGNIGDEAFLAAVQHLFPRQTLYANSSNPEAQLYNIKFFHTALRKGSLIDKIKFFLICKYIVYGGGDLWVELIGDKFPKSSLYMMLVINTASRLLGKKIYYLGCGAGVLTESGRKLAILTAKIANGIVLREPQTKLILEIPRAIVAPDLTSLLFHKKNPSVYTVSHNRKLNIGISLLYYIPDPRVSFPKLVTQLHESLSVLDHRLYKFIPIPMQISIDQSTDDIWSIEQLRAKMDSKYEWGVCRADTVTSMLKTIQGVDIMVGARLHSNILSVLSGVPSIGISYRPKVSRFFNQIGQSNYSFELSEVQKIGEKIEFIRTHFEEVKISFLDSKNHLIEGSQTYHSFVKNKFY